MSNRPFDDHAYRGDNNNDTRDFRRTQDIGGRGYARHSYPHNNERFGNRGQKRSREEDDNVDLMNQELPSKRMDRRDYTERSGRPQRKKMPGGMIEHQEDVLPPRVSMAKEIITRLGDFTRMTPEDNVLSNIVAAAAVFANQDVSDDSEEIVKLFVKAFSTLSVQIPILGTLISIAGRTNESFATNIVSKCQEQLLQSISNGNIHTAKLLLRSVAVLASCECIEGEGLAALLDALYGVATKNSRSFVASEPMTEEANISLYLLASSIPWGISSLVTTAEGLTLLESLSSFFTGFLDSYVSPFSVEASKKSLFYYSYEIPQKESDESEEAESSNSHSHVLSIGPDGCCCWDSLQESVSIALEFISISSSGDNIFPTCMSAYWTELPEDIPERTVNSIHLSITFIDDFKSLLHNSMGKTQGYATMAPWLLPKFYLFDISTISASPGTIKCFDLSRIEKHMLSSYYMDILHHFDPIMNPDGSMKGTIDTMCNHILALPKIVTRDYTDSSPGADPNANQMFHLEYLVCETFLQMLSHIPVHTSRNVAVCRVLLELCKKSQADFTQALALGSLLLYQMLPSMDFCVVLEYAKWMSFHLANTSLNWPYWDHWVSELTEESSSGITSNEDSGNDMTISSSLLGYDSVCGTYCRLIVDRLTRIFVPDIVRNSLPPAIQSWIPSLNDTLAVNVDFSTIITNNDFIIATEDISQDKTKVSWELVIVGQKLKSMVSARDENDAIEAYLDEPNSLLDASMMAEVWRATLLFKAVLAVGGQVVSVLTNIADKYSPALRSFGQSSTCQYAMIKSLAEAFALNGGVFRLILDILVRRGIILPTPVISWIQTLDSDDDSHGSSKSPISGLNGLGTDLNIFSVVEGICDRAIDFVKASISARKAFGYDMILDETLDVYAYSNGGFPNSVISAATTIVTSFPNANQMRLSNGKAESIISSTGASAGGAESTAVSAIGNNDNMLVLEEDEVDNEQDDDDLDGRVGRNRGVTRSALSSATDGSAVVDPADAVDGMTDEDMDPKSLATEAVVSALQNSRSVYRMIVSTLIKEILSYEDSVKSGDADQINESDNLDDDDEDNRNSRYAAVNASKAPAHSKAWFVSAMSLLRRVLRTFREVEIMMNANILSVSSASNNSDNLAVANVIETLHTKVVISDISGVKQVLREMGMTAENIANSTALCLSTFRSYLD